MDEPTAATHRRARHERLRELMEARGLGAVVMRRPANFAWYTCGADSRVDHTAAEGVADLVVTAGSETVLTSTIEAPRMRSEQTPEIEVVVHPWHGDRDAAVREIAGAGPLGADLPLPGAADVAAEIARLRRTLDPDAVARLRQVGRDATAAMDAAAAAVEPGMTEWEAAGLLAAECRRRGLYAPVLLAGADERIARHRHPIPAGDRIASRVMLVASAERGGLYANLTRFVDWDDPGPELAERTRACDEILARMRDEATTPGRTLADAFADCRRLYAEAGFPDEWRLHHQGGLTGYGSRELIATPATDHVIATGQAFAWNPSITGAKAEETFVLTEAGPEVVAGASLATA
jgi:Xaa-Pro dipeptidase